MELLAHIRDTITTVKAAFADGKITSDEVKAILVELFALAQVLLGASDSKSTDTKTA